MCIYFDRTKINSIDDAIPYYRITEFKSATRSTVALLSWLKHEPTQADSLWQKLGVVGPYCMHLEYTVPPPQGRGAASHTDLMIRSQTETLAVEAKWTEGRYDTVKTWLARGKNQTNRPAVLAGWLGRINPALQPSNCSAEVYQMVHRAASACEPGKSPILAYIAFTEKPLGTSKTIKELDTDLKQLRALIGNPVAFPFYLAEMQITPTAAFQAIAPPQNASFHQITTALLGTNPLFTFGPYSLIQL